MPDIGPTLREARMRDGRDILDLEDQTKIRAKYLRALENEEWSLLPGPTYTRAFLRTYGDALGLDSRLLVDEYKRRWELPHELDVVPVRPMIGQVARRRESHGASHVTIPGDTRSRLISGGLLVIVLAIWLVLFARPGSTPKNPPLTVPVVHEPAGTTGTTAKRHTHKASLVAAGGCGVTPLPSDCVTLSVTPTTAVYVCLVADGRTLIAGQTLDADSTRVTYAAQEFNLTLGSSAATLLINKRTFDIKPAAGAVRYEITPQAETQQASPTKLSCR